MILLTHGMPSIWGQSEIPLQEWKDAAYKHGMKFGVSTHLYWSPRFFQTARQYQTPGTLASKLFNMEYSPDTYASQESWNKHWFDRSWEIIEKYDPDMFNNDSPYPQDKFRDSSGVKLFSDYINRDLKENNGKQTTVLSFKNRRMNKEAFTYNMERGSAGDIKPEPWMWATDVSGNWFYRKASKNSMTIPVMVGNAIDAISKNGVVMLNVALRGDGTLPENQAAYITAIGDFVKVSSEGIYGSRPWKIYGEGPLVMKDGRQGENKKAFTQEDIRFTQKDGNLYAFVLAPPSKDITIESLASGGLYDQKIKSITMLGSDEKISFKRTSEGLTIKLPKALPKDQYVFGFKVNS